jgi:hypothetical protein
LPHQTFYDRHALFGCEAIEAEEGLIGEGELKALLAAFLEGEAAGSKLGYLFQPLLKISRVRVGE